MYSEDDIVDLILSGQYNEDLMHKDDDDYTPEPSPLNIEDKNKPWDTQTSLPPSTTQQNNENSSTNQVEDNKNEKDEIKTQNEEKINDKTSIEGTNIKKKEEEKKEDEFFPQFKNPLDFVKYLEIDRVSKDIANDMQNFILENHLKKDNKYEVSEINSLLQINNEIADIDINLMQIKKDLLLFYTKNGNILLFSIKKQKFIKSIVPKNIKNTTINCFDVTDDLQEIICGYKDGTIAVINTQSGDTKYTNNKLHKDCACIELKIYKKNKEKNELYFISSGEDGQVFYNTLKMGLTSIFWRLNSENILHKSDTSIFLIKYILNFNLSESYVILGSLEEISVYCIEPSIDKLFTIKKPNYIKDIVVPDAQVGFGSLPESIMYGRKNDHNNILLIVSWSNIIYFYQIKINKQNIINNYKEIGNYINSNNILRIGFMNKSVIYCIYWKDNKYSIKLISSSKINSDKINISPETSNPIIPEKNDYAEIVNQHITSTSFSYQSKIIDNKKNLHKTYFYSIIENNYSLFIFGEKQVNKIDLIDWEIFLNNLKKKEDFLNLFSIGIELYKGKFRALSNIPNNEELTKKVGNFLLQIISQYVIITTGEKKSGVIFLEEAQDKEKISECIKITIEFCIEIEAVEFLLKSIEPLFEAKEYNVLFLEKLIPFVLRDKLANIILSKDIILNLLELYNKNEKEEYLNQMLLHINIKSLDYLEIRDELEKMNLTIALAYLYINGENQDYFAPLQKMFEYFHTRANSSKILTLNEDNNSINYSNALNDKLITLKEILNCKEYAGHRILWYIRWILTGKKFPDEFNIIEKNIFEALVPKITYWLLNEKVISEFLKFDPKYYFMIHKNIFSMKRQYDILVKSANDQKIKISTLASLLTTVAKLNDIQPSSLIDYIVAWCKKIDEKKIYFFLYDFIIGISNVCNIKKELKIDSACFILKHYEEIVKPINKLEVEHLNRKMIDFLNNKEIFTFDDYNKILYSIVDHTFDEVKLFLYKQIDYYKECISFYMDENSNLKDKNNELFKWLNEKSDELKNTHKYIDLKDAIKKYSLNLAKISMNNFFELSQKIFWNNKKELIENLSEDLNIQLTFIELLIKSIVKRDDENENIINIDEEDEDVVKYIFGKHIFLLCELGKFEEIKPKLKENPFYPLEQCLKYCEKVGAYEGCIYLYIKKLEIEKAFNLSTSKLNFNFFLLKKNINNENNEKEQKDLINTFDKYLNDCKYICECEQNIDFAEDLWFKLLQQLYSFEEDSANLLKNYSSDENKSKTSNELNLEIVKDIKELMEKMCSYVSIKRILDVVTEENKNAGFKEFRELLIKIFSNYDNLSNIFVSARRLLTNLVLQNENSFQILNSKGELLNTEKCDKCKIKFVNNLNNKEKIVVFLCKHTFHRTCVKEERTEYGKEPICPICSELEISDAENIRDSLIKKNTAIIGGKINDKSDNFQVNVSLSSKRMIQKLQKFDGEYFEKRKMLTDSIDD